MSSAAKLLESRTTASPQAKTAWVRQQREESEVRTRHASLEKGNWLVQFLVFRIAARRCCGSSQQQRRKTAPQWTVVVSEKAAENMQESYASGRSQATLRAPMYCDVVVASITFKSQKLSLVCFLWELQESSQ